MSSIAERWRVIGGMALGTAVGLLLSRTFFSGGDRLLPSPSGGSRGPREVRLEAGRSAAPLAVWEMSPLDDQPAIHAEAIEVSSERVTPMAGQPETLPSTAEATPIDIHNRESDTALRALIDAELPSLTAEDRNVWFGVLRGLNEKESREILQIWKITRGSSTLPGPLGALSSSPARPVETPEEVTVTEPPVMAIGPENSAAAINQTHREEPGFRRLDLRRADADGSCPLDLTPGEYRTTGNPLHLAIEGPGFFRLTNGKETVCTRGGCFDLAEDGTLVQRHDGQEWRLEPSVKLPSGAVELVVTEAGAASCRMESGATTDCGRIPLVSCLNPQRLTIVTGALLAANERSGMLHPVPAASVRMRQGTLELSNERAHAHPAGHLESAIRQTSR